MSVVSTETALVVGAATLVTSKPVRETVRKGVVYGIAGVMSAGDAAFGVAKGAIESAQDVRSNGSGARRSRTASAKS